ncbi:MAG: GntR family transcriptional regulator [Dichotomicrobium sp.]
MAETRAPTGRNPKDGRTVQRQVYAKLRWALLSGQYRPGEGISIRKLADAFNTSMTPVREALRRLESEGGLVEGGNRMLSVPRATLASLQELYKVRLALEGLATEEAAEQITDAELETVAGVCAEMQRAAEAFDVSTYLDSNWRFHAAIYGAARSPLLLGMIEGLWLRAGPMIALVPGPEHFERSMPSHWAALRALQRRDGPAARTAIEQDLKDAANDLAGLLADDQPRRCA